MKNSNLKIIINFLTIKVKKNNLSFLTRKQQAVKFNPQTILFLNLISQNKRKIYFQNNSDLEPEKAFISQDKRLCRDSNCQYSLLDVLIYENLSQRHRRICRRRQTVLDNQGSQLAASRLSLIDGLRLLFTRQLQPLLHHVPVALGQILRTLTTRISDQFIRELLRLNKDIPVVSTQRKIPFFSI